MRACAGPIFGVELEIPIVDVEGARDMQFLAGAVVEEIHKVTPCIRGADGGFWSCEGWWHVDQGLLEFSSRECASPAELNFILERAFKVLRAAHPRLQRFLGTELFVNTGTTDYSGSSWGCHLNISVPLRVELTSIAPAIISLLVTSPVVTGTGGFADPVAQEFILSTRMASIRSEISGSPKTGIYHEKNEPLSADSNRVHLTCLSLAQSQTTRLLSFAIPAIGVLLVQLDAAPRLALSHPVEALHTVLRDLKCTKRLRTRDGSLLSAVECQMLWLEAANKHLDRLPAWVPSACRLWEKAIRAVQNGCPINDLPEWAVKHRVFDTYGQSIDVPWWNSPTMASCAFLAGALPPSALPDNVEDPFTGEPVCGGKHSRNGLRMLMHPNRKPFIESVLKPTGHTAADFEKWVDCHLALLEADLRWGQLGPHNIFRTLQAERFVDQRLLSEADVADSSTFSPSGRALVRCEVIHQYANTDEDARIDWLYVEKAGVREDLRTVYSDYDVGSLLQFLGSEEEDEDYGYEL